MFIITTTFANPNPIPNRNRVSYLHTLSNDNTVAYPHALPYRYSSPHIHALPYCYAASNTQAKTNLYALSNLNAGPQRRVAQREIFCVLRMAKGRPDVASHFRKWGRHVLHRLTKNRTGCIILMMEPGVAISQVIL